MEFFLILPLLIVFVGIPWVVSCWINSNRG